ncbi:MAG: SdpI family protein [Chloroflexota bacterium]|nr:SdpI family protein [Dehalococcoidia bacterium]MDW8254401.1 SdpI family protein [Chloroflexota bacterium]
MAVWLGAINVAAGAAFILLALPLYLRRVPRGWYGARFPNALKSDRHWYAVNYHAGRRMIQLAPVLVVIGLYALVVPIELTAGLTWMFALAPAIVAGLVLIDAYLYSLRLR